MAESAAQPSPVYVYPVGSGEARSEERELSERSCRPWSAPRRTLGSRWFGCLMAWSPCTPAAPRCGSTRGGPSVGVEFAEARTLASVSCLRSGAARIRSREKPASEVGRSPRPKSGEACIRVAWSARSASRWQAGLPWCVPDVPHRLAASEVGRSPLGGGTYVVSSTCGCSSGFPVEIVRLQLV